MDLERSMGAAQEIFSTSSWAQSIMALRAKGLVKKLGWRGFLRLLVHLPKFLKLFGRLAIDARVSLAPKLVLLGILAYVALPTDLVPDFLFGVGQLDDLVIILGGLKLFLRLCPEAVVEEHLEALSAGR
jgi:uncharacterized membrane protein YkvA (DUF1232 family)